MKTQWKADLALVLVTLFWGLSYYLVDLSLAELPEILADGEKRRGGKIIIHP